MLPMSLVILKKLSPAFAYYNLGNALQKIAKYDVAIASYNQAIQQ